MPYWAGALTTVNFCFCCSSQTGPKISRAHWTTFSIPQNHWYQSQPLSFLKSQKSRVWAVSPMNFGLQTILRSWPNFNMSPPERLLKHHFLQVGLSVPECKFLPLRGNVMTSLYSPIYLLSCANIIHDCPARDKYSHRMYMPVCANKTWCCLASSLEFV